MPQGLDGAATYQQILKIVPQQKAIIASGYADSIQVRKALNLGADQLIKKPYTMGQLATAVRTCLNR